MNNTVFHLLYSSLASSFVTDKMVQDILETSRENNSLSGITGLLLYRAGHFLQLLEGNEDDVRKTFLRIERDRRHTNTVVLAEFESDKKIFPTWNMGFIEDDKQSQELSKKLNSILHSPLLMKDDMKTEILRVLRSVNHP